MFNLKSAAIAAGLAAGLFTLAPMAAQAADLAIPTNAYPDAGLALVSDTWTGFYVGANAGFATSDEFDWDNDTTSWNGGVQAGYLQQFDMFVVGAEVEANIMDDLYYALTPTSGLSQTWSVAVKGRAGVAIDNTLIYGLAGVSFTEFEEYGDAVASGDVNTGFVFGLGVEQAITEQISLRAEYQQTRYWDVDSTVGGIAQTDDLTSHAFKIGANFRF